MGVPSAGAIVLVPFPFSDLSQTKLRPAVVLADAGRGVFVLCQVTSNQYADPKAVEITNGDLFTASWDLITDEIGTLRRPAFLRTLRAVLDLLGASLEP